MSYWLTSAGRRRLDSQGHGANTSASQHVEDNCAAFLGTEPISQPLAPIQSSLDAVRSPVASRGVANAAAAPNQSPGGWRSIYGTRNGDANTVSPHSALEHPLRGSPAMLTQSSVPITSQHQAQAVQAAAAAVPGCAPGQESFEEMLARINWEAKGLGAGPSVEVTPR